MPRQFLHGHVPEVLAGLQPIGRLAGSQRLKLAIGLPLRNEEALDNLIQQISDPTSPNFRQYLTPEQFTKMFGPTEQDYQQVIDFARTNGLTVTAMYPNRAVLDVNASVADIEKVFHVTMRTYRHPTENRNFFAPDVEPSVDLTVPILHISGLDNYSLPHPNLKVKPASQNAQATPNTGSGPTNSYFGNDFRAAYVPGVSLTGSGQIVGLLQFDGYYSNDIVTYENQAGLPSVPLVNVPIDGGVSTPGSGVDEVSLDIEMVIAMAPGVSKIMVFEAPNPSPWPDLLDSMVTNTLIKQFSCSWNGSSADPTSEGIFKEMDAQGQSFFCASGDADAFTGTVPFPADSTNITIVGGTTLTTTGPGGSYISETVWNSGGGLGSGGGISTTYGIPTWQQGVSMVANQGSTTMRNVPDVAMLGDDVWVIYGNGITNAFVGTSVATPLWAAFTALVNQQAAASSRPAVGFINPAVYAIGEGPNYTSDFHDITTGNNFWSSSPSKFAATSGYDLCTGWGTPNGSSMIVALATPDPLGILPGTGFIASGPVGGPFNVTSQIFSLTNSGGTSLNWALLGVPSWLNTSSGGGTLASGAVTTVNVNLNSTASNLVAGIYSTNLIFTNLTSGVAQSRQFTLQVGQPIVQNGGFETGDFTDWILNGDGYNANYVDGSDSFITPHSGTYCALLGEPGSLAYLSQNLQTLVGQNYLLSLWLNNPLAGSFSNPNEFSVFWNGTKLYDKKNIAQLNWTNMQFIVTATNSSSTLQFGARDDHYYLGLDDVTLTPIPVAVFQAAIKTNNNLRFSWNALTGLVYQVQFKTNLLQAVWFTNASVTATNTAVTFVDTNSVTGSPQKFYRLLLLP